MITEKTLTRTAAKMALLGTEHARDRVTAWIYQPDCDERFRRAAGLRLTDTLDPEVLRWIVGAYDAAYNSVVCTTYQWHPISAAKTHINWRVGVVQSTDGYATECETCGHNPGHETEADAVHCAESLARSLDDKEPHRYTITGRGDLMCAAHSVVLYAGERCHEGDQTASDQYTTGDLHLIYESLEVTSQSLDRPELGTAEHLGALMAKTSRIIERRPAPPADSEPAEPVKITGIPRVRLAEMIDTLIQSEHAVTHDAAAVAALWTIGQPLRQLWMAGHTADELASEIIEQIRVDMAQPFAWGKQIPADVESFSALHDYCDANEYLFRFPMPSDQTDHTNQLINRVIDKVDAKIRAGALREQRRVPSDAEMADALRVSVDAAKRNGEHTDA